VSWQYNGVAKWKVIVDWCEANLGGEWTTNGFETIFFTTEPARTCFMLRWT
jgi:hypothetical protein